MMYKERVIGERTESHRKESWELVKITFFLHLT